MLARILNFILTLTLIFNNSLAGFAHQDEDPTIKIQQILVNVNVTVIDEKTRNFPSLKPENFELYCEKIKQDITFFSTDSTPIILGVVFDISGSMEDTKYQIARTALNELVSVQKPNDKYFLVLFDKFVKVPVLNEKTKSIFTSNGDILSSTVPFMPDKLSTSFYDGIKSAIQILGPDKDSYIYDNLSEDDKNLVNESSDKRRKILVVISDGQDNSSRATEKEIIELLNEKEVAIYSVTITDPERGTYHARQGEDLMKDLSRKTGGYNFIPESPHQITEACSRIRKMISSCYTLGFYYDDKFDGKFKKIKIELKPPSGSPKLIAKYREGFRAPKRSEPVTDSKQPDTSTKKPKPK